MINYNKPGARRPDPTDRPAQARALSLWDGFEDHARLYIVQNGADEWAAGDGPSVRAWIEHTAQVWWDALKRFPCMVCDDGSCGECDDNGLVPSLDASLAPKHSCDDEGPYDAFPRCACAIPQGMSAYERL